MPVANQLAVIHVPLAVRPQPNPSPIQEPVPCTMLPTSSPQDESPRPLEDTSNEPVIPPYQVSHKKLFQIKNLSRWQANFVVLLLKRFFEPCELEGKNIAGFRGKEQVRPAKVSEIKRIVSSFFPSAACDVLSAWCECRKAMDKYLCQPNYHKRAQ